MLFSSDLDIWNLSLTRGYDSPQLTLKLASSMIGLMVVEIDAGVSDPSAIGYDLALARSFRALSHTRE